MVGGMAARHATAMAAALVQGLASVAARTTASQTQMRKVSDRELSRAGGYDAMSVLQKWMVLTQVNPARTRRKRRRSLQFCP